MFLAFLIWGAMITIVVVVGGVLALSGFVVEASRGFAAELDPPPVPRPARPSVTELCRHEIPDSHGKEGCVLLVELSAGVHDGRHRHPGSIFAHVLQGTVVSPAEGAPSQQHGPGDTRFEPPMQLAVRESNEGWEAAKLLIFDLAERDQLLEFAEAAEE